MGSTARSESLSGMFALDALRSDQNTVLGEARNLLWCAFMHDLFLGTGGVTFRRKDRVPAHSTVSRQKLFDGPDLAAAQPTAPPCDGDGPERPFRATWESLGQYQPQHPPRPSMVPRCPHSGS